MKAIQPKAFIGAGFLGLALALSGCGETKEALDLQGTYQSNIQQELSIRVGGVGCIVHELEIRGFDMVIRQTAFEDAKCAGSALGVVTTEGSYSIGNDLPVAPGAKELDLTINKVLITPLDSTWATVFGVDVTGDCDVKDVPVGSAKDVTGMDCGQLGRHPAKDQVYFTSYVFNEENVRFTKLPSEAFEHVGTKEAPAPRNTDLVVDYIRK